MIQQSVSWRISKMYDRSASDVKYPSDIEQARTLSAKPILQSHQCPWDQKGMSLAWQMHQMLRLMHTFYWDKVDRNIHLARAFVLAQNRVLSPNDLTINFSTAALSMGLLSSASSVWIARDANSDCDICFCRLNQKIKEFKSPWRLDT